jgi:hypothetical protein
MKALAGVIAEAAEGRIRAVAPRELRAVLRAQGAHERIRALLADLAGLGDILIALTAVEAFGVVSGCHIGVAVLRDAES